MTTPIDSPFRRVGKRLLGRLLGERGYSWMLALTKAYDIRSGNYTEPELALIAAGVEPGETVVDVGANLGLWSYHLARAVGPRGRVYAFEPIAFTAATLGRVRRLLRLSQVEVIRAGCGEQREQLTFQIPIQPSGAPDSGLAHIRGEVEREDVGRVRSEECQIVRLDDALPPALQPTFMKLDIEGAELPALRGATALLERAAPTIICEIDPAFMARYDVAPRALFSFLTDRGYESFHLQGERLRSPETIGRGNYLFVHPRYRARFAQWMAT